jgi:hypothetical protein
VQIKYYDNPARWFDKAAMTFTMDAGCEFGENSGVSLFRRHTSQNHRSTFWVS